MIRLATQRLKTFAWIALVALVTQGCDSGWAIGARNEDDRAWLLRFVYQDTRVFQVESGATVGFLASLGSPPERMRVELLNESCEVIALASIPSGDRDVLVVVQPTETLSLADLPPSNEIASGTPEIRGRCGGFP